MTTKPNYKTAEWGHLYCLSNETQPNLVKIGMTTDTPHQRAKHLSSHSGVATPFHVEFAKRMQHPYRMEQELHSILQARDKRVNHKREHFRMTPYEALHYFHAIDGEWDPAPSPYLMRSLHPHVYGRPSAGRLSPPLLPLSPLPRRPTESYVPLEPGAVPEPTTPVTTRMPLIPRHLQGCHQACAAVTMIVAIGVMAYVLSSI